MPRHFRNPRRMLEHGADDADKFVAGKSVELAECNHERRVEIHFIVFSASLSKAVTHSSRCSSLVSSILLWLMPWRLWTNIITVGTPAAATSSASCSGPLGNECDWPQVSRMDSSHNAIKSWLNGRGAICQSRSQATCT